ncbi:helix-turn-helix domain-containing protein [Loktanella salsilacus]|uniref:helix-turn-helix domain-containing protein n=1 Tax=Loktanella salsilacus TaxID=195913 RepID=UPI0037042133
MSMTIDNQLVSERLETVREALGLSKGDFSKSMGLDPSSYSKIIKCEKPLKADHAALLSERWGVTMDFIYRGRLSDLPENLAITLRQSQTQRHR